MTAIYPRWQQESEKHWRAGDYAWMASHVRGRRVLEIGCGAGFGTLALAQAGCPVLVVEPDPACLDAATRRLAEAGLAAGVDWLAADVTGLDAAARATIGAFAPAVVACWMIGVRDDALDPTLPQHQAVQKARERVQRAVAELAAGLPSVGLVHLVDRTAFPWKIKDTARETLVMIHAATTFAGLPFTCRHDDALYRKLDPLTWPEGMQRAAAGIVPVLGSLLARR